MVALLGGNTQLVRADLLTITQANGTIARLTSADLPLTVGGNAFTATGPRFTRSKTSTVIGFAVGQLEVTIQCDPTAHLLGGVPWPQAARNGALDGARVALDTFLSASWADTSAGSVSNFSGRVSRVEPSRYSVKLTVVAEIEILTTPLPRNLYQPGCVHTLYDSGCGLARATFRVSSAVTAGSTTSAILASTLTQATGYFDLGVLTFTSGANSGTERTVKTYTNVTGVKTLNLALALLNAPQVGDTFDVLPGCDKAQATCSTKFANLANFRGYPYVPTAERAR